MAFVHSSSLSNDSLKNTTAQLRKDDKLQALPGQHETTTSTLSYVCQCAKNTKEWCNEHDNNSL